MFVLRLILFNILFLCLHQCDCQFNWLSSNMPASSQNPPSWTTGSQNTPWLMQSNQYSNYPINPSTPPSGTRSFNPTQSYAPVPGMRQDQNSLFTAQKKNIEQLYGTQPGPQPQLPPQPANFHYPKHYMFCSNYFWIPPCRCFFVWMIFCYPESSNSVCWFWYGCWA